MRHAPIPADLFIANRQRLAAMLDPRSLAVVVANDQLATNADGSVSYVPNSDLFYLTGVEQEETILVLFPQAADERNREILFVREPIEYLKIWEGHKLSKDEAKSLTGITTIKWLSEFPVAFRSLMIEAQNVYLNANEHGRAHVEHDNADTRFAHKTQAAFPLHTYRRLAPLLHKLRVRKSQQEIDLLQKAVDITAAGFDRLLKFVKPGVWENEVEAELAHEYTRNRARFAYNAIIASGGNANVLHYNSNDQQCKDGDVLLMDVAANYANYAADLTRTIPINGRFTARQRKVYDAVLRVMRQSIAGATVGKMHRQWQNESRAMMNQELLQLGLITQEQVDKHTEDEPACKKYFMHGLGHVLGIDVHDVGPMWEPFAPGWVLTVEPGIYIPDEGFGVRLENNIVVTESGPIDLTGNIPVEAEEIEQIMNKGR
ncbi:aminopeptidase P N-terminal domain-containing protein [Humisphaera borealis]|uniref:Xaa-Pro aminopeptidase n=1 Tax=Humisphaera borealis TaxID=2807512 RepID=A0A7M2X3C5_9BACT|nr:aminopeptidase P N-terminal domain-containing protein [Humisphaera borealis]QOV92223.1 aminopeptidase P N-terminal domain-containing protein [Humisphaera borealis]